MRHEKLSQNRESLREEAEGSPYYQLKELELPEL